MLTVFSSFVFAENAGFGDFVIEVKLFIAIESDN